MCYLIICRRNIFDIGFVVFLSLCTWLYVNIHHINFHWVTKENEMLPVLLMVTGHDSLVISKNWYVIDIFCSFCIIYNVEYSIWYNSLLPHKYHKFWCFSVKCLVFLKIISSFTCIYNKMTPFFTPWVMVWKNLNTI